MGRVSPGSGSVDLRDLETVPLQEPQQALVARQVQRAHGDEGVALAEALVAATEKRWAAAIAAFQQAADTNKHYGLMYDQARATYKWAVMHLDRGVTYPEPIEGRLNPWQDRQRGLELLDQSSALFLRCDAKNDVDRAVTLREQMESLASKAPAYLDGLTPREVEVLRLVAGGKTDREIAEDCSSVPEL